MNVLIIGSLSLYRITTLNYKPKDKKTDAYLLFKSISPNI